MKDYEQLYYDALYKIRSLEKENKSLKQDLEIYKALLKNKDLKKIIADDLIQYLTNKNKK